jgi:predicted  nucleic acid-binding Zn-ribbon protein
LAAKEQEGAAIARKIDENDRKRNEIAEDKLRVEKQIALLEENLKMAEELDRKFDPDANHRDVVVMNKEIRRLEARLSDIRSQTEALTQLIEQALKKREDIPAFKEKSEEFGFQQLKDDLAKVRAETNQTEESIREEQVQHTKLKAELHEIQEIVAEYEAQARGFKMMMKDQQRLHATLVLKLNQLTQLNQWASTRKFTVNPGLFEHDIARLRDQGEKLLMMIEQWKEEHPDLSDAFQEIHERVSLLLVE